MAHPSDGTTELTIILPVDPSAEDMNEVLHRAFEHGQHSQENFSMWPFDEVEAEIRACWQMNGETAHWRDVRDSVRAGFEHRPKGQMG